MEIFSFDYFIILVIFTIIYAFYTLKVGMKQFKYINTYTFPNKIRESIKERYPHLKEREVDKVIEALRDFFIFSNQAKLKNLAMPSQVVDLAWHEFILFTHLYDKFCKKAFGKFYHHVPAEAMQSKTKAQDGIKVIWKLACKKEFIPPNKPTHLPLLFTIDTTLKIEDGFKYSLNCKKTTYNNLHNYCASDIGSCSGDSVGSGCGGDSSCSSGCGGGD